MVCLGLIISVVLHPQIYKIKHNPQYFALHFISVLSTFYIRSVLNIESYLTNLNLPYIMPTQSKKNKVNGWLLVAVIFLIVLLFGWLTFADFSGDTDVSSSTNFSTDSPTAPANQPTPVQ